jgi:hypothetical protein
VDLSRCLGVPLPCFYIQGGTSSKESPQVSCNYNPSTTLSLVFPNYKIWSYQCRALSLGDILPPSCWSEGPGRSLWDSNESTWLGAPCTNPRHNLWLQECTIQKNWCLVHPLICVLLLITTIIHPTTVFTHFWGYTLKADNWLAYSSYLGPTSIGMEMSETHPTVTGKAWLSRDERHEV